MKNRNGSGLHRATASHPIWAHALTLVLMLMAGAQAAMAQSSASEKGLPPGAPDFFKTFAPDTIGPGSTTRLTFTIDQPSMPVSDLAFTDTLPMGMSIADPPGAFSNCPNAVLSAPAGGATIALLDGDLGANQTCIVRVNVTATMSGTNTSDPLTSSAGSSGSATDTLTVDTARPGFSKSFSPSTIPAGGVSTLTFTIDNTGNDVGVLNFNFADPLPTGVVVAAIPNATTNCGTPPITPSVTASPGAGSIDVVYVGSASFPAVDAGQSCTVSVNVTAPSNGTFDNVSGELFSGAMATSSGIATDTLNVPINFLNKDFTNDPVSPGGTVTLQFTIQNPDRSFPASGISFDDDLEAVISGLAPSGMLPATPCGAGSMLSFAAGTLSLTGGSLPPEGMCTFSVTLAVPAGAAAGSYPNTTDAITATIDGEGVQGNSASDVLFVTTAPLLTKEFTDDPVGAGGTVNLRFTMSNVSSTDGATGIAFNDNLSAVTDGLTPSLPATTDCSGAMIFTTGGGNADLILNVSGVTLAPAGMAGDMCTIDVSLSVPAGAPAGSFPNTTSAITATVGTPQAGQPATDNLVIVGAPLLTKEFTDDPVAPGGTVTLQFTLEHDMNANADAMDVAFTDDLTTLMPAVAGLTATGSSTTCTGAVVDISTATLIDVSGGVLTPGEICTVDVTLSVPAGAAPGIKLNTTSDVTATVGGVAVTGSPAQDQLRIAGLMLIKQFTDDPAIPGDNVNLRFTLDNTLGVANASAVSFLDDLGAALSGLTVGMVTSDGCGGTPSGAGTPVFLYTNGSVAAGMSCDIDVTLPVPAMAANGDYLNVTNAPTATIGGTPGFLLDPASDLLVVDDELLGISKSFTDDPATAGGTVTLELNLVNLDPLRAASAIAFSDDLGAALAGLTIGSVLMDDCGGTLTGVGTGMLGYSGGSLTGGASCTVRLSLNVPAGPLPGDTFTNTTSTVTGTINGLAVSGPAASDGLRVEDIVLAKAFGGGGVGFPGQNVTLTFTITNLDSTEGAANLAFSDNLPAGLTAVAPLPMNPCGVGSTISGTSFLTFSGGSLGPSGMCSFPVTLLVPAMAVPGSFPNTTSNLFSSGLIVAGPGTDTLTIEPPPTFAKAFAPAAIGVGQTSTLTFTIDNASTVAASSLAFTDNLPAGLEVAAPPGTVNGCGGTVTATAGAGAISLSGGSVGAGMSCTIDVDVTATLAGALVNTTGDLTSSSGNSGTASDTLTVNPQPGFSKSFAPNPIVAGAVSTLTFMIDNSGSSVDATGLDFTDGLPAAIVIATPSGAATTCTGGTLTAPAGGGTIGYTGGTVTAGASCTITVDTTSATAGSHANTSGDLTSSLGNSGTASDTLIVNANPVPAFSKAFSPATIAVGGVSTLTFTIDNTGSLLDASGLDFSDSLPAALAIASPSNAGTTCTGGTLTAPDGGGTISYTGGTVGAGAMCTITVDVAGNTAGMHVNTSGDLTSSLGNSGQASDTLTVNAVAGMDLTLDKAFLSDPVLPGGSVAIEFTITNVSPSLNATDITFMDDLNGAIPGLAAVGLPVAGCGGTVTGANGDTELTFAGGSLAVGASCTFQVTVRVPASTAPGTYTNTTGPISGSFGAAKGAGGPGAPASASFNVAFLSFTKAFTGSVPAGGTATLVFTIANPDPANGATAIGFSDDLNAFIPGAQAVALPQNNVCGAGSSLTGTSVITLSGGNLGPSGSCTFQVLIAVPGATAPGNYTNVTGALAATVGGTAVTGAGAVTATAVLGVGGVVVVPTLTAWGLLALIGLVLMVSAARLRRAA